MNVSFNGSTPGALPTGTTFPDSSGNGYNMTLWNNSYGGASFVPAKYGNGLQFTGGQMAIIGNYNPVSQSWGTSPLPTLNAWTASVWVNIPATQLAAGNQVAIMSTAWPNENGMTLDYNPNGSGAGRGGMYALVINNTDDTWL